MNDYNITQRGIESDKICGYCLDKIVSKMKQVIRRSGSFLFEKSMTQNEKTSFKDLVTSIDIKVQAYIIEELSNEYSDAVFIAEEMDNNEENFLSELVFIIDPIDGTTNFIKSIKYSCISIGLFSFGKPVAGVVYNPYADELFWAIRGKGAYLNDERIKVSDSDISSSLVLYGTSPYNPEVTDKTFKQLRYIYDKCLDLRRFGSAALDICNVACGRAGLYFEERLSLWDYASAMLIVTEAGGNIYRLSGDKFKPSLKKVSFITGNQKVIEQSGLVTIYE